MDEKAGTLMIQDIEPQTFILLDRDRILREVRVTGWQTAVYKLKTSLTQRVAVVIDIPRP